MQYALLLFQQKHIAPKDLVNILQACKVRGSVGRELASDMYNTVVTQQCQGFQPADQVKRMIKCADETSHHQIASMLQGLKSASKQAIQSLELRMIRERHDSKGNTSWVCVACKKVVSTSKPQFTNCGFLDTAHSKSAKHQKELELQYRLDAFVGAPKIIESDTSKNSIRNKDRVIETNAKNGYTGELTKQQIRSWWGDCVDNLPEVLKDIHKDPDKVINVHILTQTTNKETSIDLLPSHIKSYSLALVTYDPTRSKYDQQSVISWVNVPEDTHTVVGVDHATLPELPPGSGIWPVVKLELVDELTTHLKVQGIAIVVCIYQIMWDTPTAWLVNHEVQPPILGKHNTGVWQLDDDNESFEVVTSFSDSDDSFEVVESPCAYSSQNELLSKQFQFSLKPTDEELNERFRRLRLIQTTEAQQSEAEGRLQMDVTMVL